MHKCPHCNVAAVPLLAVRWSYRESPAKCTACGNLSHVLASTSSGIFSVCIVLFSLAVVAAMVSQSYLVAVLLVVLVVSYNMWAWRRVELFPISTEGAKLAAQANWCLIGIAAFVKLFSSWKKCPSHAPARCGLTCQSKRTHNSRKRLRRWCSRSGHFCVRPHATQNRSNVVTVRICLLLQES